VDVSTRATNAVINAPIPLFFNVHFYIYICMHLPCSLSLQFSLVCLCFYMITNTVIKAATPVSCILKDLYTKRCILKDLYTLYTDKHHTLLHDSSLTNTVIRAACKCCLCFYMITNTLIKAATPVSFSIPLYTFIYTYIYAHIFLFFSISIWFAGDSTKRPTQGSKLHFLFCLVCCV